MAKTILITGCSAGIGKELAKEFNQRGWKVYAGARRLDAMADLAELGVSVHQLDITNQDSIDELKTRLNEQLDGKLDILYNNAGMSTSYPALDSSVEHSQQCFDVNVFGAMRMNNVFGPWVVAAKGIIVHTGSVAADVCPPWGSTYNATKGALRGYVKTLQYELEPLGVQVTDVVTGSVETEMFGITTKEPLPQDSLFHCAKVSLDAQRDPSAHKKQPAADYAKDVYSQILQRKDTIYAGNQAKSSYWMFNLIPGSARNYILDRVFKIPEYRKAAASS